MAEECKLVGSSSCCDCREIVWKIMEQVKAESDQWTEMQDMLEQVRLEMQELQSSRDTWQHRAMASDISLRSLNSQVSRGHSYAYVFIIEIIHVKCKCTEVLCVDQVKSILNGVFWFLTHGKEDAALWRLWTCGELMITLTESLHWHWKFYCIWYHNSYSIIRLNGTICRKELQNYCFWQWNSGDTDIFCVMLYFFVALLWVLFKVYGLQYMNLVANF